MGVEQNKNDFQKRDLLVSFLLLFFGVPLVLWEAFFKLQV